MRCRTSGSSAKRTISWISCLPPSSAGCALPAITSCTGRSGSSSSRLSRSGSRSISVRRLYDGTRRANPMVSTSGSSADSVQPSSAGEAPRLRQDLRSRTRTSSTNLDRSSRLVDHRSAAGTRSTTSQIDGSSESVSAPSFLASSKTSRADPGGRVHAVGDRRDRDLGLVEGRPQAVEHAAADLAVQQGDAVGALGETEAHHGHVEHAAVAALVVLGAEAQDSVGRHARHRALRAEVLLDQVAREAVDARGNGRVRGEDRAGAGDLERGVEVEARAAFGHGELADPLEPEEAGVALVGVEDLGLLGAGDPRVGAQRADATDAEQQLLEQAVLDGAAVQPVGDLTERSGVVLDVGVEQQQRHPPDLRDEDARGELVLARDGDPDLRRGAVLLTQQGDRQPVGVEDRVALLLPALAGELLAEVAVR